MARMYKLDVWVQLPDDDPTDPEDLAAIVAVVLNARPGTLDYIRNMHDTEPEQRPVYTVSYVEGWWRWRRS